MHVWTLTCVSCVLKRILVYIALDNMPWHTHNTYCRDPDYQVESYSSSGEVVKLLVGNKVDRELDREVLRDDGQQASLVGVLFRRRT